MQTLYEILVTPRAQEKAITRQFFLVNNDRLTKIQEISENQEKFKVKVLKTVFKTGKNPSSVNTVKDYLNQIPGVKTKGLK